MIRTEKHPLTAALFSSSPIQESIDLENEAVDAGIRRYRELAEESVIRGEGASLKPAEMLCRKWFEATTSIFDGEIKDASMGVPGPGRSITSGLVCQLKPEVLAVITMQEAISTCMACEDPRGVKLAKIAYDIGRAAIAQIHMQIGKRNHRESLRELEFRTRTLTPHKVNWWANRTLEDPNTDRRATTVLGAVMLSCLMDGASCGDYGDNYIAAFEQKLEIDHGKRTLFVRLTDEAWKIIDDGHEMRQHLRPRYLPMVVTPMAWTEKTEQTPRLEGGFVKIRTPLISKPTRSQKSAMEVADLTEVFECLNAVSATGQAINNRIRTVQEQIWESGGGELGIPRRDNETMPDKPADFDAMTESQKKEWKKLAVEVHRRNIALRGRRSGYLQALAVAQRFADRQAIYFPHQMDFRGREYPIPAALNHQGDDVRCSLLRLAKPVETDSTGFRWLMIHAANCFGYDKVSFDERYEWSASQIPQIHRAASDPLDDGWWRTADKPWQFLAACISIVNKEAGAHQPVSFDGTCNGLQHYAAMLRDADGAEWVNMVPTDRPRSVYTKVTEHTKEMIAKDLQDDGGRIMTYVTDAGTVSLPYSEVAEMSNAYAVRQVVKQPTMTTLYGVTPTGARAQIKAWLKDAGVPKEKRYPIAKYLADIILSSVGSACKGASLAMAWIRRCAEIMALENRTVTWKTPLGFPVVQPYRRWGSARVNTILGDLKLAIEDSGQPVALRRQRDGAPPNLIHSLDQTHMHMTARRCHRRNVDFLGTHDRFFTHAQTAGELRSAIAEEFVKLHREPFLNNLSAQWNRLHLDLTFPEPPEVGTFDIELVLNAPYFFS